MKESLNRLVAWAKAHPYAAAGIIGGVILVAWFLSKRSGGAVSLDENAAANNQSIDSGGGGLGSWPGGDSGSGTSSDLGSGTAGGGIDIPSSSIPSNPHTGNESPSLPNVPIAATPAVHPVVSQAAAPVTSSLAVPGVPGRDITTGSKDGKQQDDSHPRGKVKFTPPKRDTKFDSARTPAQDHGKGKYFTGFADGIWFVNGWPVTVATLPGGGTTNILPGGRAASNQALGIGPGQKKRGK